MGNFLRENGRWIGGAFLLTWCSSFGQTFFISGSNAEWMATFGLSNGGMGLLYMVATIGSALTLPFLGRLVDVWPEHRVIILCLPVLAAAALLAAWAPNIVLLGVALYLLRLFGQGMMVHIAMTAIGRWFAAQRGRAISLVIPGIQFGEATLPFAYEAFAVGAGWRFAWTAAAAFLVVVALPVAAYAFSTPRHPKGHAPDTPATVRSWTRAEVARDPVFWVLLTGVLASPFIGTTMFWHRDHLTALRDWPPTLFASGFTLMAATTVTFALICGGLIDRFGAKRVLPAFLLPLAAACFTAAAVEAPWGLFAFMMMVGVSYGFSSTLFGSLWPEIYGTVHLGAVRSMIMPFMVLSTAIGPGLTGTLIDRGVSLPSQFVVMGVYCLFAAGTMLLASQALHRRAHRDDPALPAAAE